MINESPKNKYFQIVIALYKKRLSSRAILKEMKKKYSDFSISSKSTINKWILEHKAIEIVVKVDKDTSIESDIFKTAKNKIFDATSKCYFITSAQNATPIDTNLWKSMNAYAKYRNAVIEVIPIRYKNPTSVHSDLPEEWWAEELIPNLIASRHHLHKHLTVLSDVKTQPTASMPLNGIEGITGNESCVIGHPRQHFKVLPSLPSQRKKMMMSTGSITIPNYTDTKIGKIAEFHHVSGFYIVEIINEDIFQVRNVSANKDGSFNDLDWEVNGDLIYKKKCIDSLILGDLHLGSNNLFATDVSIAMMERFKPKFTIIHDLMDGYSINHHEAKNPLIAMQREVDGTSSLENEIEYVMRFLDLIKRYSKLVIARSNHDDFVDRWVLTNDWHKSPNRTAFAKYVYLNSEKQMPNGILPYEIQKRYGDEIKCLSEGGSFIRCECELGIHGHFGSGGSRGSAMQFKKLNTKMITAHSHTPLILDGVFVVGTNTEIPLGYAKGLNSWMHCNGILHSSGKRQLLIIISDYGYTSFQ